MQVLNMKVRYYLVIKQLVIFLCCVSIRVLPYLFTLVTLEYVSALTLSIKAKCSVRGWCTHNGQKVDPSEDTILARQQKWRDQKKKEAAGAEAQSELYIRFIFMFMQ